MTASSVMGGGEPSHPQVAAITVCSLLLMISGALWSFVVAVLAPTLLEEFRLSPSLLGVTFSAYFIAATLSTRLAGRLVDRYGSFRSAWLLLGLAVGQIGSLAVARSWWHLILSGTIGGICLTMTNPVTNSMVATTLGGRAARSAIGIKQAGIPLSAALAGLLIPTATSTLGWRLAVSSTLLIPCLAAILMLLVRERDRRIPSSTAPATSPRSGLGSYAFFMGMIASGLSGYLALYVVTVFAGSLQRAGLLVAVLATSSIVGQILWAMVGGGRRTHPILRTLALVGFVTLAILASSPVEWSVWIAVGVTGLTVFSWQGLGMLALVEEGSGSTIGAVSGRIMRRFYLGFVIGSPLIGSIIERVGFRSAWLLLSAVSLAGAASLRRPSSSAIRS